MKTDKKKNLISLAGLSTLALLSMPAGTARALSLTCPQQIIFGTYTVSCGGASTATIRPDGTRSVTGCLTGGPGPYSNGSCNVSQTFPFQNIKVSMPGGAQITRISGVETIPVTSFNLMSNANGPTYSTSGAFANIPIGGTLNVGAAPVSGTYSGSLTVNAVFN